MEKKHHLLQGPRTSGRTRPWWYFVFALPRRSCRARKRQWRHHLDCPPTDDELINMTWRRNEKPITRSDRHSYNVTWTELSHDEKINVTNVIGKWILAFVTHITSQSVLNDVKARWSEKAVKKMWKRNHFRLGMYRITTKLQIILLKASDFEIYTWSDAELLQELREHVINSLCVLLEKNRCHQLKHKNLT